MAATSGNAVVDTLLEENAAAPADPDRMYKSEWRTFKRTVNADSDMGCDADGRYLTRANVDIYFLRHVTERDINQNSAGRIAAALQFFADNEEHKPPAAQFIVRNAHVQKALQSHAAKRKAKQKRKYQDPHANLPTNILSPSDEDEVLHCGIASQNWEDFMVSWDSCNQTMFRGDSIRLARLCDLCFDDAHGPEHINESLTIVQQCGVGKKGEESKRVVGMWRHRDWKHCGTGMIAAALFVRFFTNVSIDFSKWNNTANQPEWYGEMLVGWRDYEPMRRYFKNIYAKAGVSWGKITHVRKMAIDIAKQGGASREDISQMSKHVTDSIDIAYMPELPPEIMHILSGFSRRRGELMYLIPRWHISISDLIPGRPHLTENELALMMFPPLARWRAQHEQARAAWKKSLKADNNFLYKTLPFLAKILVQDGIHWVTEYPEHAVSHRLFNLFGRENYKSWARRKLEDIEREVNDEQAQQIMALNAGAQAAISSVNDGVVRLHQGVDANTVALRELKDAFNVLLSQPRCRCQCRSQHGSSRHHDAFSAGQVGLQLSPPPAQQTQTHVGPVRERMTLLAPSVSEPPVFDAKLPGTVQLILEEHLAGRLQDYKHAKRSTWPPRIQMGFSRRDYLYNKIVEKANTLRSGDWARKLQEAARLLDTERESMSVPAYYNYLKDKDKAMGKAHTRRKRQKKGNSNAAETFLV